MEGGEEGRHRNGRNEIIQRSASSRIFLRSDIYIGSQLLDETKKDERGAGRGNQR